MNLKTCLGILFMTLSLVFQAMGQSTLSKEQKQALVDRHNYYRAEVGSPPLRWSDDLANSAYAWAKKIAKMDKMVHSKNGRYGENIYVSTYEPELNKVVDLWASEKKFYHGEAISGDNYHLFGHYTQIIWSQTTEVGCAEAISKSGKHYWVCQYYPAGNYTGQKPVK